MPFISPLLCLVTLSVLTLELKRRFLPLRRAGRITVLHNIWNLSFKKRRKETTIKTTYSEKERKKTVMKGHQSVYCVAAIDASFFLLNLDLISIRLNTLNLHVAAINRVSSAHCLSTPFFKFPSCRASSSRKAIVRLTVLKKKKEKNPCWAK